MRHSCSYKRFLLTAGTGILLLSMSSCDETVDPQINQLSEDASGKKKFSTHAPYLIYEETMESSDPFATAHSWDIGSWDYALQFVDTPVYAGLRSARFEIRIDQPLVSDGIRSEITIVKGADGEIGKETWYSFAVYFPTIGYEYDDTREIINQWYQDGSPATSIRTQRDHIILESGNSRTTRRQYAIAPIEKDKWHTVVLHFIHSYDSDGLIELWYDGEKNLTIHGGNMYDSVLPKWKIGLYKSSFKDGSSDVTSRIIYFDNVRVGNQRSTYDLMAP